VIGIEKPEHGKSKFENSCVPLSLVKRLENKLKLPKNIKWNRARKKPLKKFQFALNESQATQFQVLPVVLNFTVFYLLTLDV